MDRNEGTNKCKLCVSKGFFFLENKVHNIKTINYTNIQALNSFNAWLNHDFMLEINTTPITV